MAVLAVGCGGAEPSLPTPPTTLTPPPSWDVAFLGSTPPPGGTLLLAPPNDTPVALSVTFSVTVPTGAAGTYSWNTALQAFQPVGEASTVPVVITTFQPMTLVEGTQTVVFDAFRTTNAVCTDPERSAAATTSLDVDVRPPGGSLAQGGPQVVGKRFDATYVLRCR